MVQARRNQLVASRNMPLPPGRRAVRAALRAVSVLTSCLVMFVSVGGWLGYSYIDSKIDRVDLGDLGDRPDEARPGTVNYLLVGTDSRAGAGGVYGEVEGQRSDTTILVHLDEDGTTTMVSFQRDMYVTIPEYTDADGVVHPAHKNKFNSAIANGGPTLLIKLVETLTNIRVDHYVSMDLQGFKEITDAIGGVEVCILPLDESQSYPDDNGVTRRSSNTNDPMSGFVGGPGNVQLNGDQALAFVRQRYGLPEWDKDRIRRQQQFIGAMIRKIMSGGVLNDPPALERLISAAASALTLDENTGLTDLRELATRMRGVTSGSIRMESVPTRAPSPAEGGDDQGALLVGGQRVSVQLYNPEDLHRIVAPIGGRVDGYVPDDGQSQPGTGGGSGSDAATLDPAEVDVAVYNGSSRTGLAAQVTTELEAVGFSATNAGNASTFEHVAPKVVFGDGQDAAARTVQAAVPGATLLPDSSVTGVQLILGSSFTEVVAPPPPGPGSPPPDSTGPSAAAQPPAAAPPQPPAEAPTCTY